MHKTISNLQLPFQNRRISKTSLFVTALPREESALKLLSVVLCFLVCTYLSFVGISTFNVIAHESALESAKTIRGELGKLERDYFALSRDVTSESGGELGLAPVLRTEFVHRFGALTAAHIQTVGSPAGVSTSEL